ncbi:MAG: MFS transporter [Chloroflexi bacterium]|nr:MFS transporter [Chloroflexota bacterium]
MSPEKKGIFYGYIIVIAAFVIMAIGMGGSNTYGVFFAAWLKEFGWTRAMASGPFSFSLIVVAVLGLVAGRLNDRFGPRLLLTISGVIVGVGYIAMASIAEIWQLYLAYGILVGAGLSGIFTPLLSTIARWFSQRRGVMSGIVLAGMGVGTIFMPLLAGGLIAGWGWRTASTVFGIVTAVVFVVAAQFLRRDPQSMGRLTNGNTKITEQSPTHEAGGLSFREALRTRRLWMLWAVFFCMGFAIFSVLVHIVVHAEGQGVSSAGATVILTIIGGVNVAGRLALGSASDRIGSRAALIVAISIIILSLVWLQLATTLWMFYLFAAIYGFAFGISVLESPIVAELFGLRAHGALLGFVDTGMVLGGTVGPVIVGLIYDMTHSYQAGFILVTIFAIAGLVLAWLLKRHRP